MSEQIYPTALFVRLWKSASESYSGIRAMYEYVKLCNSKGSAWFPAEHASSAVSVKMLKEFTEAIASGEKVEAYFALGQGEKRSFDIEYKATVLSIASDPQRIPTPDKALTPPEWRDGEYYVWLHVRDIQVTDLSSGDFRVVSSGSMLAASIADSPYYFGYVKRV